MPLIDITCSLSEYPDHFPQREGEILDYTALDLGMSLPAICINHKDELGLEQETPLEGVQINYHRFHGRAINAPDIWIKFQLSEPYPGEERAAEIVGNLKRLINDELKALYVKPGIDLDVAVDCFWGPSHGFLYINGTQADW